MSRRALSWGALAAATVVAVPLTVTATTGAWTDGEWVHGAGVGTPTLDCGTTEGFTSESYGRFLSGSVLGEDLDTVAALHPVDLELAAPREVVVTPADATPAGSAPSVYTYVNPLDLSVLGGIVGLDLGGLGLGLPAGSAGALNQYAQVTDGGVAAGASGLVNDSGGVQVSESTPSDEIPEPATITLDELLPDIANIAGTNLEVGAVGASAVLDGCAELYSTMWEATPTAAVTRQYGTAELGLEIDSPLVGDLIEGVNTTLGTLDAAVATLIGPEGLIADRIAAGVEAGVPGIADVELTGEVEIDPIDFAAGLGPLLTEPLSDGVVTVDLAAGTVGLDLTALLNPGGNGLNDLAPNTELIVNSAVLNTIADRAGVLIDVWTARIVDVLTTTLESAGLSIALDTEISVLGAVLPPLLGVSVDLTANLGQVLGGGAVLTVDAELLGGVVSGLVNPVLALLGLPTLSGLLSIVEGLGGTLLAGVTGAVGTALEDVIPNLGGILTGITDVLVIAADGIFDALPRVLSVMVNVQPDRPGAPPGSTYIRGTDDATPQYLVSALRIGLADFLTPSGVAYVLLGTASAGPVRAP